MPVQFLCLVLLIDLSLDAGDKVEHNKVKQ